MCSYVLYHNFIMVHDEYNRRCRKLDYIGLPDHFNELRIEIIDETTDLEKLGKHTIGRLCAKTISDITIICENIEVSQILYTGEIVTLEDYITLTSFASQCSVILNHCLYEPEKLINKNVAYYLTKQTPQSIIENATNIVFEMPYIPPNYVKRHYGFVRIINDCVGYEDLLIEFLLSTSTNHLEIRDSSEKIIETLGKADIKSLKLKYCNRLNIDPILQNPTIEQFQSCDRKYKFTPEVAEANLTLTWVSDKIPYLKRIYKRNRRRLLHTKRAY